MAAGNGPQALALEGVRVADFSWQIAGPTCTRYLGAMGAEVIRIESNRRPDPYRERSISHFINQSKKSVTINLSEPRGIELAKEVIALSDVVIENFAPGVIERLGLGYEELRKVRPEIVMLSSAGLGHSGPDYRQVAYGTLIQCFTGWSALQGYPGREPDIGGIWTDPMVGMLEVFLISAAVHRCRQSGEGPVLRPVHGRGHHHAAARGDPGLLHERAGTVTGGEPPPLLRPLGQLPLPGRGPVDWADGGERRPVGGPVRSSGQPGLAQDPRFADPISRRQHQDELDASLATLTGEWDAWDLMERLQQDGIPAGPAASVADLWRNPHLRERGFFETYRENDDAGTERELPTVPWRFDGQAEARITGQPRRGQHNSYVFEELLGLPQAEIARLAEEQVIY